MSFADWPMLDSRDWAGVRAAFIVHQRMGAGTGVTVEEPDCAISEACSYIIIVFRILAAHYVFVCITAREVPKMFQNSKCVKGKSCR